MNDKTKAKPETPPPQVTKAEVAATIVACGTKSDPSSTSISASIIADNVNEGKKGAAAVGNARLSASVGQCVADAYDDKKPSALDTARGWLTNVMNAASSAKEGMSNAVNDMAIKPGQGPTTVTIHNNTTGKVDPGQRL